MKLFYPLNHPIYGLVKSDKGNKIIGQRLFSKRTKRIKLLQAYNKSVLQRLFSVPYRQFAGTLYVTNGAIEVVMNSCFKQSCLICVLKSENYL